MTRDHGRIQLRPDAPEYGVAYDDIVLDVSADQFRAIQVALPAKVTLTIETADESPTAEAQAEDTTEAPQVTVVESALSPEQQALAAAGHASALAAIKAKTRCAEMALQEGSPSIVETWARAAKTFADSVQILPL